MDPRVAKEARVPQELAQIIGTTWQSNHPMAPDAYFPAMRTLTGPRRPDSWSGESAA